MIKGNNMATTADTMAAPTSQEANDSCDRQAVLRFKKRMLAWGNPVEFVNNMYGCHPDGVGNEYFKEVFGQ